MTRLRGRARRGVRLMATVPFGPGHADLPRTTAVQWPSRSADDRSPDRETFDLCVETRFAPTLQKGDVVILDILPSHMSARPRPASSSGSLVPFPPAVQPGPQSDRDNLRRASLSEAEGLKARRIGARSIDALWKAIAESASSTPSRMSRLPQ